MGAAAFGLLIGDSAGPGGKVVGSGVTVTFVRVRFVLETYFTYRACEVKLEFLSWVMRSICYIEC